MSEPTTLEIIPLGGLGEFGMNLMVYRWGRDCLVVDAGLMFPGESHLGIEVVVPDLTFLEDCGTVHGIVISHGHEDHHGALPFLLARRDAPVWAGPLTSRLVERRLRERAPECTWSPRALPGRGEIIRIGPFGLQTIDVGHSIPQAALLVLRTPVGTVVHTADFKRAPLDELRRLGDSGVLALLSDSTNADRTGASPPEARVIEGVDTLLRGRRGRVFVTTFASHIERISSLIGLAARHGRRTACVGASLEAHVDTAEQLGLLDSPVARLTAARGMELPPERSMVIVSGSQGEPGSSMSRLATGRHREIAVDRGDLVIHSARTIPGNERGVGRLVNEFLRRGADVVTATDTCVHVSGHAYADDLRSVIDALRPRFLVPLHGEYRQLDAHARIGADAGLGRERIRLIESGDVLALGPSSAELVGRVPAGKVFVDASLDRLELDLLRDRRRLAGDGILIPVLAVTSDRGMAEGFPEIVSRGFATEPDGATWILDEARRVVEGSVAGATPEELGDESLLRCRVQDDLRRFLRRRTRRRPLVHPVIVELGTR